MKAVEVDSLTKIKGKHTLLDNVSFTAEKGEFVGILGANGSGKTMLLKMICGLAAPTHGTISMNGHDISDRRNALNNVGCAIDTPGYYANYTLVDMLLYNGKLKGIPLSELKEEITDVLEYIDMMEWKDVQLSKFSKGLMKKFAIAGALLSDPDILILDEPSSGMDQRGRAIMQDILSDMKKNNKTVIMSTHFPEVAKYCDKIVILDHGKCVAYGIPDEMFTDPDVMKTLSFQDMYPNLIGGSDE